MNMLTKLKIANFKSHRNTELNTGNLTVLTGINSSGKSSVLQTLLLIERLLLPAKGVLLMFELDNKKVIFCLQEA